MKKVILIILSSFAVLSIFIIIEIKQYSSELNNNLQRKEEKIHPVWKNLLNLTNIRIMVIKDLYIKHNCDSNKNIKTLDSIILEKKSSEDNMKKNFHSLELQVNTILLELYNCKSINKSEIDSLIKPHNDTLQAKVNQYNSLINDYNNNIFKFPNTFFIDYEKYRSRRFLRIDYSNNLKNEVRKQSDIENWIETGDLPK